ncbi:hypothetical protein JCM3774_001960 [Rhodotorula dairenensis]
MLSRSAEGELARAEADNRANEAASVPDASRNAAAALSAQSHVERIAARGPHRVNLSDASETESGGLDSDDSVQILDDFAAPPSRLANQAASRQQPADPAEPGMSLQGLLSSSQSLDGTDAPPPTPDYPLPYSTYKFDILNHAPARHPTTPIAYKPLELMTGQERTEEHLRMQDRSERERRQRQLRETTGNEWTWDWRDLKGKRRANTQDTTYHSASFFPHAHLPGLKYMKGVFAVVGGDQVELHQAAGESTVASTSSETARATVMLARSRLPWRGADPRNTEELFTCAWSVNITTSPYTPMLAVAGRGRTIELFLVGQRATGEWLVHLERTITGHGGSVYHLTFHPSYPHLLASCSEDKTVRLWDATVPWGTNSAVYHDMPKGRQGRPGDRPRVEGELLAVLADCGHAQAVLSCDMHAVQPLLVTCGADGYIRLWTLPRPVLDATPHWPTTTIPHRPPSKPPKTITPVPVLGPPFFSSYAVHPGQWPDQVLFASPTTCTIISKAAVSHPDAQYSPRKSVKIWVPDALDVLNPETAARIHQEDFDSAYQQHHEGLDPPEPMIEQRSHLPADARSDNAFRVFYEAVVEDQNCIGDKIGWFRPRPHAQARGQTAPAAADNAFLVLATSTKLPPQKHATQSPDPALYLFRPFAAPTVGVRSDAGRVGRLLTSTLRSAGSPSFGRSSSLVGSQPASQQASSRRATSNPTPLGLDELAEALFPPDRDRLAHDFVPRLYPSRVLRCASPPSSRDEPSLASPVVHARCVAVDPQDAETIVAVGDQGLLAVWTRSRGS